MVLTKHINLETSLVGATRLTKKRIRSKILRKLKLHKEEDRERKSKLIKRKLFSTLVFKKAKTVMFYISFGGEVDTRKMINAAKKIGKIVAVPVCEHNRIIIKPSLLEDRAKLERGPYGFHVPAVKKYIKAEDIDLVIVPAVAFDKSGKRLGRGKGCYDHFFRKISKKVYSIGLAFDFQILPSIPTTKADIQVNRVICS